MKTNVKKLSFLVLAFVILVMTCVPAYAVETNASPKTNVSVGGYDYAFYSYIERWPMQLCARVNVTANRNVPPMYMGARARMYEMNVGAIYKATDWYFNERTSAGVDTYVYSYVDFGDYYYSRGEVQIYSGKGYIGYTANPSPYMLLGMDDQVVTVNRNENGEIFGSEIFLEKIGVKPDLIYAIGENGVEGYVKATDLDGPVFETPDDVIQVQTNRTIPLYESDGTMVIGSFIIENNPPTYIEK